MSTPKLAQIDILDDLTVGMCSHLNVKPPLELAMKVSFLSAQTHYNTWRIVHDSLHSTTATSIDFSIKCKNLGCASLSFWLSACLHTAEFSFSVHKTCDKLHSTAIHFQDTCISIQIYTMCHNQENRGYNANSLSPQQGIQAKTIEPQSVQCSPTSKNSSSTRESHHSGTIQQRWHGTSKGSELEEEQLHKQQMRGGIEEVWFQSFTREMLVVTKP